MQFLLMVFSVLGGGAFALGGRAEAASDAGLQGAPDASARNEKALENSAEFDDSGDDPLEVIDDDPTPLPPLVVQNDVSATNAGDTIVIYALENDEGEMLKITSVGMALLGTATLLSDTKIQYVADASASGEDSFFYTVMDAFGQESTSTVFVDVTAQPVLLDETDNEIDVAAPADPVNEAPVALDDRIDIEEGSSITLNLLENDGDADGDEIILTSVEDAPFGALTFDENGDLTFVPADDYYGEAALTYTVSDEHGASDQATLHVSVRQSLQEITQPAPSTDPALAFEGAEGFGKFTVGGRGGEILKVTNLDDSGEGSLRWALEDVSGPRIVIFEVGGEIALLSEIEITDPYVTIAGQTALGDGVTLTGARLQINASEVIVQGLKFRPGDDIEGQDFSTRDGLSIGAGSTGDPIENIVVDHNSFTWATDENSAIWGNVSSVTFSNNIVAQALETPTEDGRSTMGMIVSGGEVSNISIIGNFFAHNEDRNPYLRDVDNAEIVNNYIYNYGASGVRLSNEISANVIGNVFEAGLDSPDRAPLYLSDGGDGASKYYLADNLWLKDGSVFTGDDVAHSDIDLITNGPNLSSGIDYLDASQVKASVLADAGAMPGERDAIDTYLVQTALDGTGSSIDALSDSPVQLDSESLFSAPSDRDEDGIPDWYEELWATMDPDTFDAHADADGDGYSNIDDYLAELF